MADGDRAIASERKWPLGRAFAVLLCNETLLAVAIEHNGAKAASYLSLSLCLSVSI